MMHLLFFISKRSVNIIKYSMILIASKATEYYHTQLPRIKFQRIERCRVVIIPNKLFGSLEPEGSIFWVM